MKKNKQNTAQQAVNPQPEQNAAPSTTAFPMSEMSPSEELQIYYNDAYMKEKQRFNDMFGIIDEPKAAPQQQQPDYTPPYVVQPNAPAGEDYAYAAALQREKKQKKKLSGVAKFFIALAVVLVIVGIIMGICNTLLF